MSNLVTIGNSVVCRESVDWSVKARTVTQLKEANSRIRPKTVTSIQKFDGYEVRHETYSGDEFGCDDFDVISAYSETGIYLGDPGMAEFIIGKRKIKPMLSDSSHCVATIGFCSEDAKWYGWSHRAIAGFTMGDRIFDQHYRSDLSEKIRDKIPFVNHGEMVIYTLDQARLAAKNFASYVS